MNQELYGSCTVCGATDDPRLIILYGRVPGETARGTQKICSVCITCLNLLRRWQKPSGETGRSGRVFGDPEAT